MTFIFARIDFMVDATWPIKFTQIDICKCANRFEIAHIGAMSTVYRNDSLKKKNEEINGLPLFRISLVFSKVNTAALFFYGLAQCIVYQDENAKSTI